MVVLGYPRQLMKIIGKIMFAILSSLVVAVIVLAGVYSLIRIILLLLK
jgi:hypothetical protein